MCVCVCVFVCVWISGLAAKAQEHTTDLSTHQLLKAMLFNTCYSMVPVAKVL